MTNDIDRLPSAAAKALRMIARAPHREKSRLASLALEAISFPDNSVPMPLASELDDAQRAVARMVAPMKDVWLGRWAIPQPSWARMRWIGLAPPGVLDRPAKAPLWKKLLDATSGKGEQVSKAAFAKLELSLIDRLDAFADIALDGYNGLFAEWTAWNDLRGEAVTAWARREADRAADALTTSENHKRGSLEKSYSLAILLALARGKVPFDPKWSIIIDPFNQGHRELVEALSGVPATLRTRVLVEKLAETVFAGAAVDRGLSLLPHFPSTALAAAVLARSGEADRPRTKIIADVAKIAAQHESVQGALDTFKGKRPKPLALSLTRTDSPTSIAALTKIRREQVRAMFRHWDGKELPLEQRASDFGGVVIREIADAKKKHVYDALTFNADDGVVLVAGTTEVAALLIQHDVECDDERLLDALREVLVTGSGRKPKTKARAKSVSRK